MKVKTSVTRQVSDYEPIVGKDEVKSIIELAERVKGAKVIHVNATSYGGGVAEILKSIIPLAQSVGLNAKWQVLQANSDFFIITKKLHNALQGDTSIELTKDMQDTYLKVNSLNAELLDLDGDVVMIHDPQPLPLINYRKSGKWVWRCHIDTSSPNEQVWSFLKYFVEKYDALVFSRETYVPYDVRGVKIFIRYPSIDPLSNKNKPLRQTEILEILEKFGLDPDRPIIGQVARFDPWKNPLGVIDVYRKVKEKIPDIQLALIGSFAHDDPEGVDWYNKTVDYAKKFRDIYVLTNLDGVGDVEVNAFQRSFNVALQLSIREGFGLAVTEALWKGIPVVATRVGGIPLQVIDGVTGFLVDTLDEAAERVILLIRRQWLARELGQAGMEHVRRNFLITKDLKDYLRIHIELVGG
ncbi:glycosyl transferase family 1 [Candidatus Bathyarchaeota archaeon]|nr:MAG: glycosyl transferase family 1 [Candidatus Bathyarchaeota archaeon]